MQLSKGMQYFIISILISLVLAVFFSFLQSTIYFQSLSFFKDNYWIYLLFVPPAVALFIGSKLTSNKIIGLPSLVVIPVVIIFAGFIGFWLAVELLGLALSGIR